MGVDDEADSVASVSLEVLSTKQRRRQALLADLTKGLAERPRRIPPVWFYDELGSRLFEQITALPEYYLTRAESQILQERAHEVAKLTGAVRLVELGSGTSAKTTLLLEALAEAGTLAEIALLDISAEVLEEASFALARRYQVPVKAVVGDFESDLHALGGPSPALWILLGSTIGNFEAPGRLELLASIASNLSAGDYLLLGADLVKDSKRLVAAYDDSEGVTASFNRNVLEVLNKEISAGFEPQDFEHVARWDPLGQRVEMRLRASRAASYDLGELGGQLEVHPGEEILTEICTKFERQALLEELSAAGLEPCCDWTDLAGDFLVTLSGLK